MILIHESLPFEAEQIAKALYQVYGFESKLVNIDLNTVFIPIPQWDGYHTSSHKLCPFLRETYPDKAVLVLTPRDIYANKESKNDDWLFGYALAPYVPICVVSTARMKGNDNLPRKQLEVSWEQYIKRLEYLSIHEVGHDVVDPKHMQEAYWVNAKTDYHLKLGPHCTNSSCVMYEIVDIQSPPAEEGYMLLGEEKKYDAGLDSVLKNVSPSWFCNSCKDAFHSDYMVKYNQE